MRALLRLARWLGPWARGAPDVAVREDVVGGVRVRCYGERGSVFVIAPGLHPLGPADLRADRFHRILAVAGHRVVAPYIDDYLALVPGARACRDFDAVVAALPEPATIFSISFGSLLALHAAATHPSRVARLIVFGGYAELMPTLRFMLSGTDRIDHASVALPVLDELEAPGIAEALRSFIARGDPQAACDALPAPARIAAALARATRLGEELDALPLCARVRCRVDIVHGTDDTTVPVTQTRAFAAALSHTRTRVHVLRGYGHTTFSRAATAIVRDAVTSIRILRALS